ncbi:hypothetical protein BJ912DRAFT_986384 [Pholiota molesta]|nr:hypothetical protein BJ912DRAFT_986384 [Pholiota molesta]
MILDRRTQTIQMQKARSQWKTATMNLKEEPPAKKARRSVILPQKQAAAPVKKKKKSLSLLPSMPLDVIFEVNIPLSCSSKLFHETLSSSGAKSVWKPKKCPSDLKEIRWAQLLFGRSCENCGRESSCTINLYVKSKVAAAFPDCDDLVLSLIPYTNIGAWAREMTRTVARYKRKQHKRVPGAQQELAAFIAQRRALTGQKFNSWFNSIFNYAGHCC